MIVYRCEQNPLLLPSQVKPSRPDFQVEGVFNCGVTTFQDEFILLCRVAESAINSDPDQVIIPMVEKRNGTNTIVTKVIRKSEHNEYDFSDSRSIWTKGEDGPCKIVYLTSLSHFRIARSKDGVNFTISEQPDIFPDEIESWGIEDPRITLIDGVYYITYTSVASYGASTSLITTKDFIHFERKGIIFAAENKDVTIFPEKIDGCYWALNRPVPMSIGNPDIWIAQSPDLLHWGQQKHLLGVSKETTWINGRIGGGAVPVKTERGWLVVYHAADKDNRYCLGAMLLDKEDPSIILANTSEPILEPEEIYEKEGFFGNVVFTCGVLLQDDNLIIYYGAADDKICRADIKLSSIYEKFTNVS